MALIRTIVLLFGVQLRAILRSKRGLVCALLALGPVAVALLVRYVTAAHDEAIPAFELGWILMVKGTVPLVSLILGSAVIAEEIEDRTITYLFTRPIPRAGVLIGRLAAAVFAVLVLLGVGAELAFTVLQTGAEQRAMPEGMAEALRNACLLGGIVYTTLFSVAGALFKHPMIVGIGYTFVVEGFVSMLPGQNASITIQHHLRSWLAGLSPSFEQRMLMTELFEHQEVVDAGESLQTLMTVFVVALAVGIWTVSRKQYVLPS